MYLLTDGAMGEIPEWWIWFYMSHFVYHGNKTMYELYSQEPILWINRAKAFYDSLENARKQRSHNPLHTIAG